MTERTRGVFAISVAADMLSMQVQNLRVYERRGLVEPARTAGGTRLYSPDDLDRLARIRDLLAEGLNIAGIARVLALEAEVERLEARVAASETGQGASLTGRPISRVGRGAAGRRVRRTPGPRRRPGRSRSSRDTTAATWSVVPSWSRATPAGARCRSIAARHSSTTVMPSSPPSMASSGSSGNRPVSARGTHGGSAMISGNRSSRVEDVGDAVPRRMLDPVRQTRPLRRCAAMYSAATGFTSTQTSRRSGPRDRQQADLAGPGAQLQDSRPSGSVGQQLRRPQRLVRRSRRAVAGRGRRRRSAGHRSRWSRRGRRSSIAGHAVVRGHRRGSPCGCCRTTACGRTCRRHTRRRPGG